MTKKAIIKKLNLRLSSIQKELNNPKVYNLKKGIVDQEIYWMFKHYETAYSVCLDWVKQLK